MNFDALGILHLKMSEIPRNLKSIAAEQQFLQIQNEPN